MSNQSSCTVDLEIIFIVTKKRKANSSSSRTSSSRAPLVYLIQGDNDRVDRKGDQRYTYCTNTTDGTRRYTHVTEPQYDTVR